VRYRRVALTCGAAAERDRAAALGQIAPPFRVRAPRRHAASPSKVDLPPESGGVGSERHAATGVTIASMLALASVGVR